MVNGQGSLSGIYSGCQLYVQLLVLLKYLRAAASVQPDPVYKTVSSSKFIKILFFSLPGLPGWPQFCSHTTLNGDVLTAHPPKWVGILLTVWLLLTVCHEYGGGAGYDMLALGIGYSRFIKVFYQISIFPLLHFWFSYSLLIKFWSSSIEHLVTKVYSRVFPGEVITISI